MDESLAGQLLLASPSLHDPNFERSVVLIGVHNAEGAMGVVLNRPSELTVAEAAPQLEDAVLDAERVFVGGPVQPSSVVFLAEFSDPQPAGLLVLGRIGFPAPDAEIAELSRATERARVFAGFAGWGEGQLEAEIEGGDWIAQAAMPDDVFTDTPDSLWSDVLTRKGGSYALVARNFVERRPRTIAAISAIVMLAIAAPATALRLGSSDASNDPPNQTTHRAYELLARGFGEGFNGPLLVVARVPAATGSTTARGLAGAIGHARGVASVVPPKLNPAGDVATISVYPRSSPQAYATTQLVERLRDKLVPPIERSTGAKVYVGGVTAGSVDFATTLGHKLPLFIGVVVLLSALLLMIVFRSLVIPLQAAVMNLLSIGAALGVIVAIFQWGWLGSLIGVQQGPIESFIPVMLFAIVFGLSMDYEVFLVSRIHERWAHTRENSRAVAEGLALTGRVVTAAAAIMVCVFLSFMLGEDRVIKEFGLSLASAVFLDALVVRCLLLPAVLHLIGPRTWALPGWLDRLLPRLNIEGTVLPVRDDRQGGASAPGTARRGARPEVATEGAEG
ncbi:MAG: YqgE/AlgH family protein [Solirubrobacteraceae bacterium]